MTGEPEIHPNSNLAQLKLAWLRLAPLMTRLKSGPIVEWICLFAFVGLVSPTVINYAPYALAQDESYYLHRMVCVNHAVYDFSLSRLDECLSSTHKGPIMEVVNLPWGRAGGTERGIGLAFVSLALFIWILVLATCLTCLRGGIPPGPLLLAGAAIYFTPFLRASGGAMMTDILLGWCVALALMLIPLEYNNPQKDLWSGILRGLLWGLAFDIGMLSKVTFAFFLSAIFVAVVGIRERYSGEWPLRHAVAGCVLGAIPCILIWYFYGLNFLRFALAAAWGRLAPVWGVPGMTAGGYLRRYFGHLGLSIIPLSLLLVLFVRGMIIDNQRRMGRLLPIGIILGYLGIAAMSKNRDPRFAIPVMIAMPIALAWTSPRKESAMKVGAAPVVAALFAVTLFSIPMAGKPETAPVRRAGELLRTLYQGQPIWVVIATDGPQFNIETLQLARQLGGDSLRPENVGTLVYDAINERTLDQGLRSIDASDYVLFLKPGSPPASDWAWSRVYARDYRAYCEKVGILMDAKISPDVDVFKIRKAVP